MNKTVKKLLKFFRRDRNGFTLIELFMAVALLGILMGILFMVLKPEYFRGKSRDSARLSNVSKIASAAEVYASLEGGYPETQDALKNAPVYIATWPDDEPASGDAYIYTYDSTDDSFTISTSQSDGTYLVYSSNEGQTLECPTGAITEGCSTSSGGLPASVPLCMAEGDVCESDPDCCPEAPYCYGGVCHLDPEPPPDPCASTTIDNCSCTGSSYCTLDVGGDTVYVDCNADKCWSSTASRRSWWSAVSYCSGLDYGGKGDWILPDRNTLRSLCSSCCSSGSGICFNADGQAYNYWSSTERTFLGYTGFAYYVYFDGVFNCSTWAPGKYLNYYVRCVR